MTVLELKGVSVSLRSRQVLRDISFQLRPGSLMALVGPNGAGKSTLLRATLGLVALQSGSVLLRGQDLTKIPMQARARNMAYLAQGHHAVWPIRVRRLVALGRLPHRNAARRTSPEDDAIVDRVMAQCGVAELSDRTVDTLSGGEKARVMLARALAVEAQVLLVDEPIAALDPRHQLEVMIQLHRIAQAGAAVVCVLHDLQIAARFCNHVMVLADGALIEQGPPLTALAPAVIRRTYGVEVATVEIGGENTLIPWSLSDTK